MQELTLFDIIPRKVPAIPEEYVGSKKTPCGYTASTPREWTDGEIGWIQQLKQEGFTTAEIAESVGRTETSIAIKLKRIGKKVETYNEKHREEKYAANREFLDAYNPKTILDAYYGIEKLSDFTTSRLIDEFRRIGWRNKKDPVPIIVKEWPRISRVYFEIRPMKITEQWTTG